MESIISTLEQLIASGNKAALCIIVSTTGSSPRKEGTKMIVLETGEIKGTIGGGSLELQTIRDAMKVMESGKPQKFSYELEQDLEMNCGGSAEVYIEPFVPEYDLHIFGAGHVGKALAKYAPDFGFSTRLIDHRKGIFEDQDFNKSTVKCIDSDYLSYIASTRFSDRSCIVIVTPEHKFDEEVLGACINKPFAYLGMIGSKSKIAKARKNLKSKNIANESLLDRVDMPIGLDFAAETPGEIAISILAGLVDLKNRK